MSRPSPALLRPRIRRSWLQNLAQRWLMYAALSAGMLTSCSFGEDETMPEQQNSCEVDADCSTQRCEAGRCVAKRESTSSMDVTVVVTPKRTPSGSQPLPIVAEPFALAGGKQTITLPHPVSIPVHVTQNGEPIAAQASFTPLDTSNRYTAKTTKLTIVAVEDETQDETPGINNAMLLDGTAYRVLIQPSDATIPPHGLVFTATTDEHLDVEYAEIKPHSRKFILRNAAHTRYQVRAVSEVTGDPLSDSAEITGSLTIFTLRFDDPDASYSLEFSPAGQRAYSTGTAGECGQETPEPKLSIPSSAFMPDATNPDWLYVELPELHEPIEYAGVIGLCDSQERPKELQVTLKTNDLYLKSGDSETVTGEFETAAAATWDDDEGKFRFCARVPPGTYTVVVPPPPGLSCEIFAERRLLDPEWSGKTDELALRKPAVLSANVLTPDRAPMPKATVELLALGSGAVTRAPADRSVPGYNRSSIVSTDADGNFTLPVDRGRYDVVVKPPETSNYAWSVIYEVTVAASEGNEFATEVMLHEPVAVTGQLRFKNGMPADQASLASAEVRAYTLVSVEGDPSEMRSVEIGSGQADEDGVVTLLLPPSLQHSWNP